LDIDSSPLRRGKLLKYYTHGHTLIKKQGSKKHKKPFNSVRDLAKNQSIMLGQSPNQEQANLFKNLLAHQLNPQQPRYLLGQAIPWKKLARAFAPLYGSVDLPSHPIRKMAALLMLKHLYKLSDERVVAMWQENPYYQYFAGEATFQWGPPCAASDLVHFRHRLGEKGIEKPFVLSMALHADKVKKAKEVIVDTTVPEKNITFPTDAKLYKKVIEKCNALLKIVGLSFGSAIGFWYNAWAMCNVMPTWLGMLKKPSGP